MLEILLYPELAIGPTMVGPAEEKLKVEVLRWLEKTILILVFANTVNYSFNYMRSFNCCESIM